MGTKSQKLSKIPAAHHHILSITKIHNKLHFELEMYCGQFLGKYQYNILIFFLASQFNSTFYESTPQFCPHCQVSRWAGFCGRCSPFIPLSWFWSTWCSESFSHTTPICIKAASKFGCTASVCTLNCYLSSQKKN